ncbi:MAG: hypothetical protein ABIL09_09470 [Gemmatimonadota bacterium]
MSERQLLSQVRSRLDEIYARYDEAGQEILRVAWHDGHFPDQALDDLVWPASRTPAGPIDASGLEERARLVARIYEGIPRRRDARLWDAYQRYAAALPPYREANRHYLQARRQFLQRRAGTGADFLQLYHAVYLQALGRENAVPLDEGEAALVEFHVARPPLAHAAAVAEKLAEPATDDPRWEEAYTVTGDGRDEALPLRPLLTRIAERVVDALAAGEHLAVRYNCFSNFVWFGISVLKVVSDVDVLLARLRGRVREGWRQRLEDYVHLDQAMLLKFLQAHSEDPAQLRPREFWYGQEYSYLTRDMIDVTRGIIDGANRLRRRARDLDPARVPPVETPPLLAGTAAGRFLEYAHVGPNGTFGTWERRRRVLRWLGLFRTRARRTGELHRSGLDEREQRRRAWANALEWADGALDLFGIEVRVAIDPEFVPLARELGLEDPGRHVVFFPTHQSLLDHPVMQHVLASPELLEAMGWKEPVPCCKLARAGLMDPASIRFGSRRISLLGVDSKTADHLMEEVDGYVIIDRADDSARPTARFAKVLDDRPGVVYGAGTTAAFGLQVLPMQHALFAYLPPDIVVIPMAFRGIHGLWPKCPKGNMDLHPGVVEVYVSPPMPGETTLLPRKRALRTQLEPATFFQAVHLATLLNPEPSAPAPR